jgi:hypothetical protein
MSIGLEPCREDLWAKYEVRASKPRPMRAGDVIPTAASFRLGDQPRIMGGFVATKLPGCPFERSLSGRGRLRLDHRQTEVKKLCRPFNAPTAIRWWAGKLQVPRPITANRRRAQRNRPRPSAKLQMLGRGLVGGLPKCHRNDLHIPWCESLAGGFVLG